MVKSIRGLAIFLAMGVILIQLVMLFLVFQVQNNRISVTDSSFGILYILATVVVIILILLLFSLFAWAKTADQEIRTAKQEGLTKGAQHIIEAIDADPSVLRNVSNWLYDYRNQRGDLSAAASIFAQLLDRLEKKINLQSLERIGEVVPYNPHTHRTLELGLHKNELVKVIEAGWIVNNRLVRKPLVGRKI